MRKRGLGFIQSNERILFMLNDWTDPKRKKTAMGNIEEIKYIRVLQDAYISNLRLWISCIQAETKQHFFIKPKVKDLTVKEIKELEDQSKETITIDVSLKAYNLDGDEVPFNSTYRKWAKD